MLIDTSKWNNVCSLIRISVYFKRLPHKMQQSSLLRRIRQNAPVTHFVKFYSVFYQIVRQNLLDILHAEADSSHLVFAEADNLYNIA